MEMDWGKETPQGIEVYPEGTYKVRIDDYQKKTASTGTPQLMWRARIIEPVELEGKTILEYTALTEKSLWKLAWLVSACGVAVEKLGKMEVGSTAFNQVLEACKGRTVYFHVIVGTSNQGKQRNEIDDFKKDTEQEPIEFSKTDDVPEFLREE